MYCVVNQLMALVGQKLDENRTFCDLFNELTKIVAMSFQEFDPAACRINVKGEFYYHPKLKDLGSAGAAMAPPDAPMMITDDQVGHFSALNRNQC